MKTFFFLCLFPFLGLSAQNNSDLVVPCLSISDVEVEQIPQIFSQNDVQYFPIATINWPQYPYAPDVDAAIAYADNCIMLHFRADTRFVVANVTEDFGRVFRDCCVEFFVSPVDDGTYYNIECNCLGYLYMQEGRPGGKRMSPPPGVLASIKRWTSLGCDSLGIINTPTHWEVALSIPYTAFYKHNIKSLTNKTIKANFHCLCSLDDYRFYLSWAPVPSEKLTFHHLPKRKLSPNIK